MKTNGQIQYCPTNLIKHRRFFPIIKAEVTYDVWVAPFSGLFGSTSLFPLKGKKKMTLEMGKNGNCSDVTFKDLLIATHLHQPLSPQAQNAALAINALLEYLQAGSSLLLDFSLHWHMYSGNIRQRNFKGETAERTERFKQLKFY